MTGWIKRLLPRTLFGRALLIIVSPLILVQLVSGWFFFDRHWETVSRRLSGSVAAEIVLTAALIEQHDDTGEREALMATIGANTQIRFRLLPGRTLPPNRDEGERDFWRVYLARALEERLAGAYSIDTRTLARTVIVTVSLPDGLLEADVPRDRIYFSTAFLWLFWMVGSSLILVTVAGIFMRNQVRPVRRLAAAAEAFGKGRRVEDFKVVGAIEVRQAAMAFKVMRDRIQRQIQQRTEMLAGVSHDLRTPLTRMKLGLALLPESEDTAALRDDVAEMERMLDAYLAFARGEGTEESTPTDLDALVADVVAGARRSGADITLEGSSGLVMPLRPNAFKRALDNLVGNAVRHARRIGITLRRGANAVEVVIDDDGPGIPVAKREEVFRPFLRLEGSRNRETGGVGLGLSIARDIVQSHGGTIRLGDSPRGGLRAVVRLPL